jgi:uncharacterized protein YdeI (YjbR/CyaY-like superfamily)
MICRDVLFGQFSTAACFLAWVRGSPFTSQKVFMDGLIEIARWNKPAYTSTKD